MLNGIKIPWFILLLVNEQGVFEVSELKSRALYFRVSTIILPAY